MKRPAVILLLLVTLLSQTELHQLLKLPALFKHFTEHRAQNHNLSLAGFLVMHYMNHGKPDGDEGRDKQLPFKSAECVQGNFLSFYILTYHSPLVCVPVFSPVKFTPVFKQWIPRLRAAEIWQPPRNA